MFPLCIHLIHSSSHHPFIDPSIQPFIHHLYMHMLFPAHKFQRSLEEVEEGRDNLRLQLEELNRYNRRLYTIKSVTWRRLIWCSHDHNHLFITWLFYYRHFHLIYQPFVCYVLSVHTRNNEPVTFLTQFTVNQRLCILSGDIRPIKSITNKPSMIKVPH